MNYYVLLYYYYTTIEDPAAFKEEHLSLCLDLNLKGRIIVASEGINGTLSGLKSDVNHYMDHMKKDERFKHILFKIDEADRHAFEKMHVRVKKELVNLSLEKDINPLVRTGKHLRPEDFKKALEDPDTIILDARNDYEYELGHFKGAIKPDIKNFRDLPDWIKNNKERLENKKIVTYCTGGVRCEKFSGWLLEEGFNDVSQLDGGIVMYGKNEHTKGELWNGKLYVFDNRISVDVNRVNPTIVGKEHFTGEPCERYKNCSNPFCNKQILLSESSEKKYLGACSLECLKHPKNRYVLKHDINISEYMKTL